MDEYTTVDIRVTPFTAQARERVMAIYLGEYHYWGDLKETESGELCGTESRVGLFDGARMTKALAEALGDEGRAYIIKQGNMDAPHCVTYYYLGDGAKLIQFSDEPPEKVAYTYDNIRNALQQSPEAAVRALYQEIYNGDGDAEREELGLLISDLADLTSRYGENISAFKQRNAGPCATAFYQELERKASLCTLKSGAFEPSLSWEQLGIAQFSPVEKKALAWEKN